MRLQITVELLYSFSRGARCTDIGSKLMKGCLVGLPSNQITIAAKSEHRVPLFAQKLDWQTPCLPITETFWGAEAVSLTATGKEFELTIRLEDKSQGRTNVSSVGVIQVKVGRHP